LFTNDAQQESVEAAAAQGVKASPGHPFPPALARSRRTPVTIRRGPTCPSPA